MSDKWVVDAAFPQGHLVPMTPAEQAEFDAFQAAQVAGTTAQAAADANAATMLDRIGQAISNLETAAANWGTITAVQKDAALKLTVQVVARLARLILRRLDQAT
jgi:hypothetical protein